MCMKLISVHYFLVAFIATIFFVLPFFWLPDGFVDLGGDSGRLYFFDPDSVFKQMFLHQVPQRFGSHMYGILPYVFGLSVLKVFIPSMTYLIAFENGIKLLLSFLFMYLFVIEILSIYRNKKDTFIQFVGVISGLVYVGFITKYGWVKSLETHHYVFLNIAILYLFLKFISTNKFIFAFFLLLITFFQSQNFSFSASPQIFSFYPFALAFLFLYCRYIRNIIIPWRSFVGIFALFVLLHGFHLVPMIATIFDKDSSINNYIFSEETKKNAGLSYFDHNRQSLGKISMQLFQPEYSLQRTIFVFLIPLIGLLGFIKQKSKLLSLIGIFFLITLFLISANITIIGIKIYRMLFSIPGFMMFRSFDEKWHGAFSFFYTLLFATSFYLLFKNKKNFSFFVGFVIIFSILLRILPFLKGDIYRNAIHPSTNIPVVFDIPPGWINSINAVKSLKDDSNIILIPLTFPYFQIFYGNSSGAYVGISTIQPLTGRKDFAGFWDFGVYEKDLLYGLNQEEKQKILQIFSLHNIKYVLKNSDQRIFKNFLGNMLYNDIRLINSNDTYNELLSFFPTRKIYQEGFFELYEISKDIIRPALYIPDIIYSDKNELLYSQSFRSASIDKRFCESYALCYQLNSNIPNLSFYKKSPFEYVYAFTINEDHDHPFILALLEYFNKHWNLYLDGEKLPPIRVNEYATGWIIHPEKINKKGEIYGVIKLEIQKYFVYGRILTVVGIVLMFINLLFSYKCSKRNY